jgi:hypothetical protein
MRTLTRAEAIAELRRALLDLVDDQHSMCEVAARNGIYCLGFRRLDDDELRKRYAWLAKKNPGGSRADLEDLANRWQLARQVVHDVPLSCDAQAAEHDLCGGWDDFSAEALVEFHQKIRGETIQIEG